MLFNFSFDDHKQQRRKKRIDRRPERLSNIKNEKLSKRVNLRSIARYAVMPEILPRVRNLGMHFGHFAYLIALILNSARLIPHGHPTLNPRMIGQYSVRGVLAFAANNIQWRWKNVDQIAIFTAIVTGLIMVLIQAVLIALYAFTGTANAQETTSFFSTPAENVQTDVVLIFLDQVFGANLEIFGAASQPTGTPVYIGLQKILGLYSMATMVIAVIIVLYYILTVIGEAAKTGTPFGQRFNSLWAPIRLVVALGLLVPLATGLNSAQYLTLFTAKMGSGLATQVWSLFTAEITDAQDIVSKPPRDDVSTLITRIFLSEVCAASFNQIEEGNNKSIKMLQNLNGNSAAPNFMSPNSMINAAKAANMAEVDISWSSKQPGERANDYTCGHITVSLAEFDYYTRENDNGGEIVNQDEGFLSYAWNWVLGGRALRDKIGTIHETVRNEYISQIGSIAQQVRPAAEAVAAYSISVNPKPGLGQKATLDAANIQQALKTAAEGTSSAINTIIETSYEELTDTPFAKSDAYDEMIKRGWGAAGLWYGNLTKINQKYLEAISSAAPTLGTLFSAPAITDAGQEKNAGFFIFGASRMGASNQSELEAAILLAQREYGDIILSNVSENSPLYKEAQFSSAASGDSGLAWVLVWMLGGGDIYALKENPSLDPMARIGAAGHAILFRSVLAFTAGSIATASSVVGNGVAGLASAIPTPKAQMVAGVARTIGEFTGALASLFFVLAGIALVAGIFLAFVIPFLPFVYFSFAVIGWVLEIFEAIIAMPLWALAHLRIDGDGMPGQAAIGGYQLLLMILLRPVLIVFGLVGGYVIFGAAMYYFSSLYNAATSITQQEITGNSVNAIGVFIYTLIFAFLTYNIAIMCFKMIDDVPKGILRWMGAGVQPFGDSRGDPIGGTREVVVGGVAGATALGSGLKNSGASLSKANERRGLRKKGLDPDDMTQKVKIVDDKPDGGTGK